MQITSFIWEPSLTRVVLKTRALNDVSVAGTLLNVNWD